MIESIALGVLLAAWSFGLHVAAKREIAKRLNAMHNDVVHAKDGVGNVHDLLAPAVAQLPKTRAKKAKPAGTPQPRAKKVKADHSEAVE